MQRFVETSLCGDAAFTSSLLVGNAAVFLLSLAAGVLPSLMQLPMLPTSFFQHRSQIEKLICQRTCLRLL